MSDLSLVHCRSYTLIHNRSFLLFLPEISTNITRTLTAFTSMSKHALCVLSFMKCHSAANTIILIRQLFSVSRQMEQIEIAQ